MVKNSPASARDTRDEGLIPGPGGSPGEGNGSSLQYSCLKNPLDREAWLATVHVRYAWATQRNKELICKCLSVCSWHGGVGFERN